MTPAGETVKSILDQGSVVNIPITSTGNTVHTHPDLLQRLASMSTAMVFIGDKIGEQSEMLSDIHSRNHQQDLNLQELRLVAKVSGKLWGILAGCISGVIGGIIIGSVLYWIRR